MIKYVVALSAILFAAPAVADDCPVDDSCFYNKCPVSCDVNKSCAKKCHKHECHDVCVGDILKDVLPGFNECPFMKGVMKDVVKHSDYHVHVFPDGCILIHKHECCGHCNHKHDHDHEHHHHHKHNRKDVLQGVLERLFDRHIEDVE